MKTDYKYVKIFSVKPTYFLGGVIIKSQFIDTLSEHGIKQFLTDTDCNITVLDTVDSTNLYLKRNSDSFKDGDIVIARSQTLGRGRFTRKFHSPQGSGIYMSLFLKSSLKASDSVLITTAAAVAVSEACEHLSGKSCSIKWVNDILINSKKICGILTEGAINSKNSILDYAILGIGINVYEPSGGFEEEIKDIAGFVFDKRTENLSNRLAAEVINRFHSYYNNLSNKSFLQSYRKRSNVIGKNIYVLRGEERLPATALEIDDDCRLLVEYPDKKREYLCSGEISIKKL